MTWPHGREQSRGSVEERLGAGHGGGAEQDAVGELGREAGCGAGGKQSRASVEEVRSRTRWRSRAEERHGGLAAERSRSADEASGVEEGQEVWGITNAAEYGGAGSESWEGLQEYSQYRLVLE